MEDSERQCEEDLLKGLLEQYSVANEVGIWEKCALGDVRGVERLLKSGNLVDELSDWGVTPLHIAASNGHIEVVELLLRFGGSIYRQDRVSFKLFYTFNCLHSRTATRKMVGQLFTEPCTTSI